MIRKLSIYGLNGRDHQINLCFNEDLNLLTGRNGCGKTTILKILWYINSCNFKNLLSEINFQEIAMIADEYSITISMKTSEGLCYISIDNETPYKFQIDKLRELPFRPLFQFKQRLNIERKSMQSMFFPTFRRIEGGFSMESFSDFHAPINPHEELKEALNDLSNSQSSRKHKFVCSISTEDIVSLLQSEYTRISDEANKLQENQYTTISNRIKHQDQIDSSKLIELIKSDVEDVEFKRQQLFLPFNVLSQLIQRFFEHKGISLDRLTIGDVNAAISSDKLSAGEKQMLSFLCYNTFSDDTIFFIDEPELSLHPDWQRTLVPTLLSQNKGNQFFMATHSPFIYTKYSDKEIIINEDKGGC